MPSLSGVEAWRADDRLPPAVYLMRPAEIERDSSKAGNPQVIIDWRVQNGEYKGAEQRDYITLTEAAMGRVVQVLEAGGIATPDTDFESYEKMADWLAEQIKKANPLVEAIVRDEDWIDKEGQERTSAKIKGYRKPSSSDVPSNGFTPEPGVKDDGKPLPF